MTSPMSRCRLPTLRRVSVRLFLALVLLGLGCQAPPPPRPNIVLILIDTLRADRLSAYGHPGDLAPTLDALARDGVVFERAIAQAPWTQPSVASLFTSLYPSAHHVLDFKLAMDTTYRGKPKVAVLGDAFATIAEVLQAHGYATAGFVANPFLHREFGFAQGFDHFDASFARNVTSGSVVNGAALAWLRQRDLKRPFFLYLHYMDVHGPYDARPELLDPLLAEVESLAEKQELSDRDLRDLDYLQKLPSTMPDPERHRRLTRYREYWVARYDGGVRELDHHIANLIGGLQALGVWEDCYVIVTSDHGEALYEHRLWNHGHSLHQTEFHVPLILRWPGSLPAGKRIASSVRSIDVLPTIADQLRLSELTGVQGASLLPRLRGGVESEAFAEAVKLGPPQHAVLAGEWKLIWTPANGHTQLFRLSDDPGEQRNVAGKEHQLVSRLRDRITAHIARNRELSAAHTPGRVTLSEEQVERLRALGYAE